MQNNFLGLVGIFCPAALRAAGTTDAVLAAVPCGGYKLAILLFRRFTPELQFSPLRTDETVLVMRIRSRTNRIKNAQSEYEEL